MALAVILEGGILQRVISDDEDLVDVDVVVITDNEPEKLIRTSAVSYEDEILRYLPEARAKSAKMALQTAADIASSTLHEVAFDREMDARETLAKIDEVMKLLGRARNEAISMLRESDEVQRHSLIQHRTH